MYEEMKKKFETGDYICVLETWLVVPRYEIKEHPDWYSAIVGGSKYHIIHKKHKDILDAFLEDNNVEIEFIDITKNWNKDCDFIKFYNKDSIYRLKLTNEDKQEISNQVDAISETIENQLKVTSSTVIVGTGKDIANNIGNHLNKNYEYEIIIKQIKP